MCSFKSCCVNVPECMLNWWVTMVLVCKALCGFVWLKWEREEITLWNVAIFNVWIQLVVVKRNLMHNADHFIYNIFEHDKGNLCQYSFCLSFGESDYNGWNVLHSKNRCCIVSLEH